MKGRLERPRGQASWVLPFLLGSALTLGVTAWRRPEPVKHTPGSAELSSGQGARPPLPALTRGPMPAPGPMVSGGPGALAPDGSPNSLYPLSFPKILAGFLYFSEHVPALSPTAAQCQRLLPLLEGLGPVWAEVNGTGRTLFPWLSPGQLQHIAGRKHTLETSIGHAREPEILKQRYGIGLLPQGLGVYGPITLLCTLRGSEPDTGPYTPSGTAHPEQQVTPSDIAAGLIYLEEDSTLRLSPAQARGLRPTFERLIALNALVELYFSGMEQLTTTAQVSGIGAHIQAITAYKHGLWKDIPDSQAEIDPPDPLISASIRLCRNTLKGPEPQSK